MSTIVHDNITFVFVYQYTGWFMCYLHVLAAVNIHLEQPLGSWIYITASKYPAAETDSLAVLIVSKQCDVSN